MARARTVRSRHDQVTSLVIPVRETRRERAEREAAEGEIAELLAADAREEAERVAAEQRELQELRAQVPRLGPAGKAKLRPWWRMRLVPHKATTAKLYTAFPFLADQGLGSEGMLIGRNVFSKEAFSFDPWMLYQAGVLTNPNVVLAGEIGKGKSSLAKSLVVRGVAFGRRAYIPADPKGEWTPVVRALGGQVIEVGPGSPVRINPLDPGPRPSNLVDDDEWELVIRTRRLELLESLAEAIADRRLDPVERSALSVALDASVERHDEPVLSHVVDYLFEPPADRALPAGFSDREELIGDGRGVGHSLGQMTTGVLAGVFDGPSTVAFDTRVAAVSIDLSRFDENSPMMPLVMACTAAWMEAAVRDPAGGLRWMIYDEGWRAMKYPALLRRMQSQWKLARAWGIANFLVIHRLSDLDAIGDEGSSLRALADGLLADCSTRIIYAQQVDQVANTVAKLGLTTTETEYIPNLHQAHGLWKVGQHSFIVEHQLSAEEWPVFATDARMATVA
ncbi:MAG: ATP-binding protein [Aeromicrobium sp.]|uniref:ATP-binding protein n=1 Tax=Aeromicrobium sp. TaxID=1871063 RepID=UPI0039E57EFE